MKIPHWLDVPWAFPSVDLPGIEGLSILDYFAAHAPTHPEPWFKPEMPDRPKPVWTNHAHNDDGTCSLGWSECLPDNWRERDAWVMERDKQRLIQWPYAWALEQVKIRNGFEFVS